MPRKKKTEADQPLPPRPEPEEPLNTVLESDASIDAEAEAAAAASDTFDQASDSDSGPEPVSAETVPAEDAHDTDADERPAPEPAGKLERLQKILAQAGIASRRHAEELVTQGRVQVNGKTVTELGSKADAARDHIRVDGKLLQGSERLRYFVLNKPKGYVTTVSDPEGRPTIMEFFSKMRERLYPVGRLDYLSEGLLLVTNDGELANKLTRAALGVEKTYLVKVSGQPSEEDIDRLRQGVGIERGKPGSARVQTAPAQVRLFRPAKAGSQRGPRTGENPWYEVVLIEGRNRELRKMFEEIGHHVEKIRRIGYGPLELDLEPGKIRELDPQEVENLRKAADGKYHKPRSSQSRKRDFAQRAQRPGSKPDWKDRRGGFRKGGDAPSPGRSHDRTRDPGKRADSGRRTGQAEFGRRPGQAEPGRRTERAEPARRPEQAESGRRPERGEFRSEPRREFRPGARPSSRFSETRAARPAQRDDRGRPPNRATSDNRDRGNQPQSPNRDVKGSWNKPGRGSRPPKFERSPSADRSERPKQFQRTDRPARGEFRPRPAEGRPQRFDRKRSDAAPDSFSSRKKLDIQPIEDEPRGLQTRSPGRNRPDRPPFQARSGPRPDRIRSQGSPSRQSQQRRPAPAEPRPFNRDRPDKPRFDRPDRNERTNRANENRPARPARENRPAGPARRSDQRSSSPRPGGSKPGKRGASGAKPGTTRSGSGRRPGSRPGGNRGNKRRP
ncbi:MAG TPA: pseudouridine synthase [Terracidiphilus sp.]